MKKIQKVGLILAAVCLILISAASPLIAGGQQESDGEVSGKIEMTILGIGGWLPSSLGVEMSPLFSEYAKEKYGYEVEFSFEEAPFDALFQKAATSLATKSQEYNLIISDSQWLGAFAEPGWIVDIDELIKENPELDIEWYDPVVEKSYINYPDGTDEMWGLPQEGDAQVLYVRQDLFSDPAEMAAFKAEYGYDLPQTFEDWEKTTFTEYEQMCEFFTRPDEDFYGLSMQYHKNYDYITMDLQPFMFSLGGELWDANTGKFWGVLNSDENAKAMEWNKRMLQYNPPGALNYSLSEKMDAFTQGKVATCFHWAALGSIMTSGNMEGKVMVVPPPAFERADGSLHRVYSVGGQPWVINAYNDEEHMKVAIDFLKWWYSKETQLEFLKRGGLPTTKASLTAPGFEDMAPWLRAFKYMLRDDRIRDFWHEPKYAELLAVQQEGFTAYASGIVSDPKNTLDWIALQQQKIMYDAGRTDIAPPDLDIKLYD